MLHVHHRMAAATYSLGLLLLLSLCTSIVCDDVILPPVKKGTTNAALILIQGLQVKPEQYVPLATAVQSASDLTLWVGIPEYPADVPQESGLDTGITRILKSMASAGMNASAVFFGAHSLSGTNLQDYLLENRQGSRGQILLGSFLKRKNRDATYPFPTLTVGGELDGVCRVTRIMEEYWHRTVPHPDSFPTVVVKGMSHFQFASGDPPEFIKDKDLKPEISYSDAHKSVGTTVALFLSAALGSSSATAALSAIVRETDAFLQPLLLAYQMEGSYVFKPPCNEDPPSSACTVGCPWTERAVTIMGGPKVLHVNDTDAFHPADEIFPKIHHPQITGSCSEPVPSCVVNITSDSQNVYQDKDDSGLEATSASEIKAKIKSRQSIMEAAGMKNVSFNTSDGFSICKLINEQSYKWALSNAAINTLARFNRSGVPMVMGEDKGPYNNGAIWIWYPLVYTNTKNSTGGDILEIQSISLVTKTNYILKSFAGMHFCKLLSPARVMEWIYVDGLRAHLSIGTAY